MYHFFKRKKLVNHGDFTTTNLNTGEFCLAEFLVGNIHRWFVLGVVVVFFFVFSPRFATTNQPVTQVAAIELSKVKVGAGRMSGLLLGGVPVGEIGKKFCFKSGLISTVCR